MTTSLPSQGNGRERPYGPHDPHPLSRLNAEFVWDGKYDEYGNRRELDLVGWSQPLQRIETIDEPRARAEAQGSLFDQSAAHSDDYRNMLVWGDNKLVAASLLGRMRGEVDLVYIDPPFDVGADFTMDVDIGDKRDTAPKDQSLLEMIAYRDMWGKGADSYLHMMYERLLMLRDLLKDTGTLVVHVDYRVTHQLRAMLDELFGQDSYLNEVIWYYTNAGGRAGSAYARKHNTLHVYTKSDKYTFNWEAAGEKRVQDDKAFGSYFKTDDDGRMYQEVRTAKKTYRYYLDDPKIPDDVWQIQLMGQHDKTERTGYATQKPESLLERVVAVHSNPGDLVVDLFCGSGTTGAVAERLGRRWIMADLGRFAIHTSRKRLIEVQRKLHAEGQPYRAFDVFNLGRYERQWWQKERLAGADDEHRRVVLEFYRAEQLSNAPSPLIHGRKGPALCHVDGIDGLFTREEAAAVASAVKESGGKEVACLAWEFEMDLRMECDRLESELGVKIKLIQIPREIMEKNRKEPPPFLEVATLTAEPVIRTEGKEKLVDIKLTSFIPSLAEVPTKELEALQERAVKSGFDFIDFWAVDFMHEAGQPFAHHWQDYRTRKDRSLKTVSDQGFAYDKPGTYTACVKVVDIFGSDTSINIEVQV